jgi:predicted acylesterase/phospholipase RssA
MRCPDSAPPPAGRSGPMRWWENGSVRADVAGVFEGGGAKGLAYAGATAALCDHGRWFCAVAGASAGAITAALIAAGADPEQLERWTHEGLQTLASQLATPPKADGRLARARFAWRALHHLASPTTAAIATSDDLGTWLRARFATLVGDGNVTFKGLFEATEIELTVVAVDLIQRKHRIFCHSWTPDIAVAEAVIASSSIPFALPAQRLSMDDDPRYGNPIVDGGVWTNFPTFVFHDHQFRAHHGLPEVGDRLVLGFLLDEEGDENYVEACDRPHAFGRVPASLRAEPAESDLRPAELLLSYDDRVIGDAVEQTGVFHQGRIAAEARDLVDVTRDTTRVSGFRTTKRLPPPVESLDPLQRLRDGKRPGLANLLLGLGLLTKPFVVAALLAGTLVGSIGFLTAVIDRRPHGVGWMIPWVVALTVLVTVLASAFVLSAVLLVAHSATHWPMRKYGILLAATYTAGSGAPYWCGRPVASGPDDGVIRLPIPRELTTMSFDVTPELRADVVRRTYKTTSARLTPILRNEDQPTDR